MDKRTTVGIDLAKDVFAVCVLDAHGAVLDRKVLRRAAFERWAESLSEPCTVAMEACGSAHHWGRFFAARGHTARLLAAEFVVPFRQGGKNDGNDALAIAIAARQPTMRFVSVKTVEQQAILAWHRMRQGWIEERTALLNRVRGLLAAFGLVAGRSPAVLIAAMPRIVDEAAAPDKATRLQLWMVGLARRCGYQKALVAIANKHARMIWAMLARDERYDPEAWRRHARTQPSDATGMPMPSAVGMS